MRRPTVGAMVGTMAGITLAVALHTLLQAQPQLAAGWLGTVLLALSAPGARLVCLLTRLPCNHELGMVAHWISLQLTLVSVGALVGTAVAIVTGQRRQAPPNEASTG